MGLAGGALLVAVRMPLEIAVFAVLVFGLPHVALEVRYLYGRFVVDDPTRATGAPSRLFPRWLVVGLQLVLVTVVVNRFLLTGRPARVVETVLLGGLLLAAVLVRPSAGAPRRAWTLIVSSLAVIGAAALALRGLDSWFLVQAHLHNILPFAFVWEWTATEIRPVERRRSRVALLGVFVVVPVAILLGAADPWIGSATGVFAGTTDADAVVRVSSTITPGGTGAGGALTTPWPGRLLAAFAFAQLVHYAVWCWFLPRSRAGREATIRLASTRLGPFVRHWRYAVLVLASGALVLALASLDLGTGRGTYTSIAAYHALLEFPLLLLLVRRGVYSAGASSTHLS